jgi:aconitase A
LPQRDESGFFNESFSVPEVDSEVQIDLTKLDKMMAQMRPQIELAVRQSQKNLDDVRRALDQQRREMQKNQREFRREMQEHGRELRDEIRKELHGLAEI